MHLTSFESKLDLPISELYQGMSLARDEVRGDMQTIIKTLQRMEQRMEQRMDQHMDQRESAPTVQHHNSITIQVRPG